MSVDATSPAYDAHKDIWAKMRDVAAGEEAVKARGQVYLPKLGGQSGPEYEAYTIRASFLNATGRTIDGLSGMIFRKPPVEEIPGAMAEFMEDVDGAGLPFQAFAEGVVEEILTVTRGGLLVDFPASDGQERTQAQAQAEGRRPYWTWYKTEAILGYQTAQVGNRTVVTQVRLAEKVEEAGSEEFESAEHEQIRVLELADGKYQQRVFRKLETGEYELYETIVPTMNGNAMDRIPFIFFGPRDLLPAICKPVLLDLANKNLDHYRLDADYHHGLHFVALPTPWARGVTKDEIEKGSFDAIGPTNIWLTTSTEAEFGMLEFTGTGIQAIEKALERCEGQMAMLGARMLAPEKRMVEAAETAKIRVMGENSVLSSIAQSVSMGLTKALQLAAEWMAAGGEARVELNRDFLPVPMDPQTLTALMAAWMNGGISKRTLFENLQRGEVIEADRSFEDEEAEIETDGGGLGELRGLAAAE